MKALVALLMSLTFGQTRHVAASNSQNPDPAAVITFRERAAVNGRIIHLGDIAVVESRSKKLVTTLEAIEVGSAPVSRYPRSVSADYSIIRVRQAGFPPERLQFGGATIVEVMRQVQTVSGADIEKAAFEALEASTPETSAKAFITPNDLIVPIGVVEIKANPSAVTGSTSVVPVDVFVNGHAEARVSVGMRLLRRGPALVAVRDIPAGSTIGPLDVKVVQRAIAPGPVVLTDLSSAVGSQASGPIASGTTLTSIMVRPRVLIKSGTRIKLVCKSPAFTVSAQGEALQDGVAGQVVRVRNASSGLELSGRVIGPEVVEVQF